MKILLLTTLLFLSLVMSISAFSDEAFDFFVEACRHSGYNPSEISTFQAELKIVTQASYPDSVAALRKQQMAERINATYRGNEAGRQASEEETRESLERMFSCEAKTEFVKVSLRNTAAPIGVEDVLGLVLLEDMITKRTSLFQKGTQFIPVGVGSSLTGLKEQVSMSQATGVNTTMIHKGTRIGNNGGQHYSAGRITSPTMKSALSRFLTRNDSGNFVISDIGIAAFKKRCKDIGFTFTLSKDKVKYEEDYFAHILEIHEKGRIRERFWIDPDRGYICPKEQMYHTVDGTLIYENTSEQFLFDEHSQKWFPQKWVSLSWSAEGQDKIERRMEIDVTPGTLVLNRPVPDSAFAVAVREGGQVDDFRRNDNDQITFIANQPGRLSLSDVENQSLDDIPWLTPREVRQYYPPPIEIQSEIERKLLIMLCVNITIIALFFAIRYYFLYLRNR